MSTLQATVQFIKDIPFDKLVIPDYQRPYVWQVKELRQLWDDILQSVALNKKEYRIGTIILFENLEENKRLEIVDGQQRLTTLSLLLYMLSQREVDNLCCASFLQQKQFLHQSSSQNILKNCNELRQWVDEELSDSKELLAYILNCCSVTILGVDDISAAFQIFDTQNGRGLTLQAYNLLKAYHMRFLECLSENEKIKIDKDWEASARNEKHKDYLEQVIHEQLYRSRVWSKNHHAYRFSKKQLREFKGSSKLKVLYPYENYVFQSSGSTLGMVHRVMNEEFGMGFQMNQLLVNGSLFFDYVQTYVRMYQYLFEVNDDSHEMADFRTFYIKYCTKFTKKGDGYLLELYKSLVMCVYDRFGVLGLKKYYKLLYAYVFRFRLQKKFVKYDSVAQFPAYVFSEIQNAKDILDLRFIQDLALAPIVRQESNRNNTNVENFFAENFNVHIS